MTNGMFLMNYDAHENAPWLYVALHAIAVNVNVNVNVNQCQLKDV